MKYDALDLIIQSIPLGHASSNLGNPRQPVEKQSHGNIENDIHPSQAKVPPSMIKAHGKRGEEIVRVCRRAVVAVTSGIILEISSHARDVNLHVFAAGVARRCCEGYEFVGLAVHRRVRQAGHQERFYYVCKWIGAIHEDPEPWENLGAAENSTAGQYQTHSAL